ncbi:MAG TPA: hypothetical protein VE092_11285 [Herbaspirillum sp.]|uniref:hypothetical protein n=1 Tax=Herbaspirillum sp. TaxID=1890675 RepID=UPI002D7367BF|nr:hypothetical protein [Herbaspirillum sp.]HZG20590.1 hypothetical protein [Herbaspirillum sp.]
MNAESFYAVDADVVRQTEAESELIYSINMGAFTIHHGYRDGVPITIAEHHNQQASQLSGIWLAQSDGTDSSLC